MKPLALLFCFFSTVLSTYALASQAALMHFDQQLKALTATITSVESKIKELSQLLVDLQRERKGRGARQLYDDFQKYAQKRFVSLFNELMNETVGKNIALSQEHKGQLIKITHDFDTTWPSGRGPLTYPKLHKAWDDQRQARQKRTSVTGASTTIAQTFRKIAENVGAGVQQGLQALQALEQKAKEKAVVAQVQQQAEVVRPVVAQPVAKKEEEEKKRELVVAQPVLQERKQEAAEQEKKSKEVQQEQEKKVIAEPVVQVAQPVVDSEAVKQLTALEVLLKTYKSDLDRALKTNASQQEKNKLFKQLKNNFIAQRKALNEYTKTQGHTLAPEQEKQLQEIIKDYDKQAEILIAAN